MKNSGQMNNINRDVISVENNKNNNNTIIYRHFFKIRFTRKHTECVNNILQLIQAEWALRHKRRNANTVQWGDTSALAICYYFHNRVCCVPVKFNVRFNVNDGFLRRKGYTNPSDGIRDKRALSGFRRFSLIEFLVNGRGNNIEKPGIIQRSE